MTRSRSMGGEPLAAEDRTLGQLPSQSSAFQHHFIVELMKVSQQNQVDNLDDMRFQYGFSPKELAKNKVRDISCTSTISRFTKKNRCFLPALLLSLGPPFLPSASSAKLKNVLATGYLHQHYAESLSEFGDPLLLRRSGGWLLRRRITGELSDAMGIYPLFACSDWRSLSRDFEELGAALVSVVAVVDPFGDYDQALLRDCFPDAAAPFKSHFVADLSRQFDQAVSKHHVRNAEIGLSNVAVERCVNPSAHLDDWAHLYGLLIERHQISGMRSFSRNSFSKQLGTPGMVCFRALRDGQTVGMILWYVQNNVAYYHLGAYTDEGYELRASFALFRTALDYFAQSGAHFASLGAGAGLTDEADDGLSRFKRGWSTSTRPSYLCGRIFNRSEYDRLVCERGVGQTSYFPAYREGEFH